MDAACCTVLALAGLSSPLMRAFREMTHPWEIPCVLDDTRFRRTFGFRPTLIEAAAA